jgi:hypothetical protein
VAPLRHELQRRNTSEAGNDADYADYAGDGDARADPVHGIEADLEDPGVGLGEPGQRFPHRIPGR